MFDNFPAWWDALSSLHQIYWGIAIPFTLIFLIQTALTFVGGEIDGDTDMEIDAYGHIGFQFFTIKNLVVFFTLFGWTGLACLDSGLSLRVTLVASLMAGLIMMSLMAQGLYEVLTKQAQGLDQIVKATGGDADNAAMLLITDKLPELFRLQSEAIQNIKIDKVTVWEGGGKGDEKTSTANFISGLYKSVPPLQDMFNMAGMELPEFLKGKTPEDIRRMADELENKSGGDA
tara:strand:- start:73 stop:765 length:693 start_codon:yes stop_codon:yes gene_type:complete